MKRIFITGGGSGIGAATARLFAERGWQVGLADINATALAQTAASLPAGRASTHVMDVRDRDQWQAALADFAGPDGGIDVLMNNAGIAVGGPLIVNSWDEIDRVVAINLMGVVNGAKIGHRHLKAAGGCLLNTASAAGIYGGPGIGIYAATKFAVRGLTESLDIEWAADGIRVRSLMPSFIETPLLDAGVAGTNHNVRETVRAGGMEITPVVDAAEAAWRAVHGDAVHTVVGKTARRMAFAARWMPGGLRKQLRRRAMR
ncbi:SDR family oxidoreductase [Sphingomonas sp.]|uniref:SDR family oxidoreductase n=1 Tax=Sphingomonas sp. TaxID=28214 RepID=UPI001DB6942C|nr:SDR family oxidoreductase [Sphingomonas sp.]MBX9797424.1 SDR family oxidoreductase [Sphingomonas sp.]